MPDKSSAKGVTVAGDKPRKDIDFVVIYSILKDSAQKVILLL